MKKPDLSHNFNTFYQQKRVKNLYPTEFVIRMLLGSYPGLSLDKGRYAGSHILDLGFGDGRNFPLLHDLGMQLHGVELNQHMIDSALQRFHEMAPMLKIGSNAHIPFKEKSFDYVLSCHSCYYVEDGKTFDDNLSEIARVLKPGGIFVFSLPKPDNFILQGAIDKGNGHYEVKSDPYGLRNGTLLRAYATKQEIASSFAPYFEDCRIGFCAEDYFGIFISAWIGAATRTAEK